MGEVPGSIPGEGSTVVGDHPPRERSAEPSDPDPLRPRRGTAAASAAPGKPAAADRKAWASVDVAQLVARLVANEETAGSIPAIRTEYQRPSGRRKYRGHIANAPLAQLGEASDLGSEGSRFESGEGYVEAWLIVGSDPGER